MGDHEEAKLRLVGNSHYLAVTNSIPTFLLSSLPVFLLKEVNVPAFAALIYARGAFCDKNQDA